MHVNELLYLKPPHLATFDHKTKGKNMERRAEAQWLNLSAEALMKPKASGRGHRDHTEPW